MTLDRQEVVDALPGYEIGGELGRGGWGVVLAGTHRQLGRQVAVKQLPRAFAADATVRARFIAEARVLAALDHPHIVPVYDYVERDGLCLLVMEQLPGGTVWSRFSSTGFTPPAAAAAVLASIAGLQAAHDHQVLHRDIKPENLMFSAGGALKVTDFGIAKVVGGDGTLATRAGEVVGTPAYIAPEQARGGELSPATDVYAVATMFYELLSGRLPFDDDGDAMALLFKHAFETPTPLRESAPFVPDAIGAVVMKGLATDPADRFDSAEGFGVAIAEACTTAWGTGWLAAEGSPVMGASSIVAATERVTSPPRPPTVNDGVAAPAAPPAPPTIADTAPPRPPTIAEAPPVRPAGAEHDQGAQLADVAEDELVPVQSVLTPPPRATVPLVIAVVLLLAALAIALLGIGRASGGDLARGAVTVAGVDPTSGEVVKLDLSEAVPVAVGAAGPATADRARLSVQAAGQQVSSGSGPLQPDSSGTGRSASVDLGSARYLVGGRVAGEVEVLQGTTVVGHQRFGGQTAQFGLLTAAGAVVVLLLLFAVAYAESFARSLRRGKRTTTATVGLTLMGLLIGAGLVGLSWVLAVRSPTVASLLVCAVLGAGAGAAAAIATRRRARSRRFARLARREATT